jgi:hypothetical protein
MRLRDGMIEWLGECFEGENFVAMSTAALMDGIERHWEGGMRDFLDSNPDLVDVNAMSTLHKWTRKRYSV